MYPCPTVSGAEEDTAGVSGHVMGQWVVGVLPPKSYPHFPVRCIFGTGGLVSVHDIWATWSCVPKVLGTGGSGYDFHLSKTSPS